MTNGVATAIGKDEGHLGGRGGGGWQGPSSSKWTFMRAIKHNTLCYFHKKPCRFRRHRQRSHLWLFIFISSKTFSFSHFFFVLIVSAEVLYLKIEKCLLVPMYMYYVIGCTWLCNNHRYVYVGVMVPTWSHSKEKANANFSLVHTRIL